MRIRIEDLLFEFWRSARDLARSDMSQIARIHCWQRDPADLNLGCIVSGIKLKSLNGTSVFRRSGSRVMLRQFQCRMFNRHCQLLKRSCEAFLFSGIAASSFLQKYLFELTETPKKRKTVMSIQGVLQYARVSARLGITCINFHGFQKI